MRAKLTPSLYGVGLVKVGRNAEMSLHNGQQITSFAKAMLSICSQINLHSFRNLIRTHPEKCTIRKYNGSDDHHLNGQTCKLQKNQCYTYKGQNLQVHAYVNNFRGSQVVMAQVEPKTTSQLQIITQNKGIDQILQTNNISIQGVERNCITVINTKISVIVPCLNDGILCTSYALNKKRNL